MFAWMKWRAMPAIAAGLAVPAALAAQAARTTAPMDACALATTAEVQDAAETKPEMRRFASTPEPAYGGRHCDYSDGSIEVYESNRAGTAAQSLDRTLKIFKIENQPRVPVQGLGDKAFFMIPFPDDDYRRAGMLFVYTGAKVLQLSLDAKPNERLELTKPRLERLAKLVLPRIK